jgi:cytochrome P450
MHGTIDQNPQQKAASDRASSIPLEQFNPGDPELFRTDTFWPYFDRLRREDPVHYCKDSMFGPYWSVTKYNDIMDIETNHAVFSSAASLGGITIRDVAPDLRRESFIAMDQPRHSAQRKTVAPMFTPTHLDQLAINIHKWPRQAVTAIVATSWPALGRPAAAVALDYRVWRRSASCCSMMARGRKRYVLRQQASNLD